MSALAQARDAVVAAAHSLHRRGLTHGSTGNISLRVDDAVLITPTGSSLGTVTGDDLSLIALDGRHLSGGKPSKEAFLHLAMLRARPGADAVVHTHSTHAAAVSCLSDVDPRSALPPLTAYFAMRVGQLPLLPYHAPGDDSLGDLAEATARRHPSLLLSNHGPVVTGAGLAAAVDAAEELEETAKLFFLLRGMRTNPVAPSEAERLHRLYG